MSNGHGDFYYPDLRQQLSDAKVEIDKARQLLIDQGSAKQKLEIERDELKAEIEKVNRAFQSKSTMFQEALDVVDRLEKNNTALKSKLEEAEKIISWLNEPSGLSLSHKYQCEHWTGHPLANCTCGLDALKQTVGRKESPPTDGVTH